MHLTKRVIDQATYPYDPDSKRRYLIMADNPKGFGLRVYPSGQKTFFIRYTTRQGRRRMLTLGDYGPLTVDQARTMALAELGDVAGGGDPAEHRDEERTAPTMKMLCVRYIEEHAKLHKKSWQADQRRLYNNVLPQWGSRKASSITFDDVARIHHAIGRRAPVAANRVLEVLRKMFNLAEQWGNIPRGSNPATGHQRFKEKKRDRWLTPDEVSRLVQAIDEETKQTHTVSGSLCEAILESVERRGEASIDDVTEDVGHPRGRVSVLLANLYQQARLDRVSPGRYSPRHIPNEVNYLRAVFWMYLLTGARKTELLTLRWKDVDLVAGVITLRDRKGGDDLEVPLSSPAKAVLSELLPMEGNPHVFPGRNAGGHLANIDKAWRRIRDRAGLQDVHLHDLRRTVGSWLVQSGNSLLVAQKALGHASYASTLVYARLNQDPIKEALEEHGRQVMAAVKGEGAEIISLDQVRQKK